MIGRKAKLIWVGLGLIGFLACQAEKPFTLDDPSLGVKAVFPGEARMAKYSEDTPFGNIDWFSTAYAPSGRLDVACYVNVGNLPPGTKGGSTSAGVLDSFEAWMKKRFTGFTRTELPPAQGPGFRYRATVPTGAWVEGIVVVRRGRLHHAQATTGRAGDPRGQAFLSSFEVRK
ncbi:MAG: hypothetical protein H6Q00_791 [Holophagaceae bacterium]|nr:hypothetical protein [Holophagaceae bacterium]